MTHTPLILSPALLREAAARAGTPFYIHDAAALRQRVADLRATLPDVAFFYSLKANPNLSIVRTLTGAGTGAEVSSRLELETALEAGASPDRILMVGPGKSTGELRRAVDLGLKAIVVEALEELDEISALATTAGKVQAVALRINPDFQVQGARLAMSGRATQFGIDQSEMAEAIRRAEALPGLRLAGLHVYMGTRILSVETLASNTRQVLELARDMIARLQQPLDFVDVGGGFGVPYYDDETPLNLAAVGEALRPLIAAFRAEHAQTRVAIELGRYMVAEAGLFVTSVRRVKTSKSENFAICDGGANLHAAAAGQGFMRRNFAFTVVPGQIGAPADAAADASADASADGAAQTSGRWTMTGPLCTPMDVILSQVETPAPHPGDLVCIHQSGAYGASASPVDFLGFGGPAELLADGDSLTLARPAPDWQSRLAAQRPQALPQAPSHPAPTPAAPLAAAETCALPAPFNHPALARMAPLRPLFESCGAKLEQDPAAWTALWADPTVRALTTIGVPDSHNGFPLSETGLGLTTCPHSLHVALIERLARFDPSCILALPGPSLSGGAVLAAGSPDQIDRFFRAYRSGPQGTFFAVTEPEVGSDASNGSTLITPGAGGGMVLNGTKMLVGGIARAAIGLVFARIAATGRAALVMVALPQAADHVTITRLPASGLKGADLCRIDIRDLPVTPDMLIGAAADGRAGLRDGFMAINGVFERNRPVVAALALGNARGLLDRLELGGFGAGFTDMALRYRALLGRLAAVLADQDRGTPRSHRISELKFQAIAFSDDLVRRIAAEAAPLLFTDSLLRRKMRDAKAFEYMEGTSNIHLLNAFRAYLAEVPA